MNFCSDNAAGAHRAIVAAIEAAAGGNVMPYGNDDLTRGVEKRLAEIFDIWRTHLADALLRGQRRGYLRADADPSRLAQFLVAGLEGAILLSKVTRDIAVMEKCVEELKQHLTLYRT